MEARVFRLTEKLQKKDVKHEKNMSEVLENATNNYKKLEDEHFKNINIMKETEVRAQTEETKRAKAEAEIAEIREKMRKLESECILSIRKAQEEGMAKGKKLGKEGAMEEVKAQFQMVYNSGFRHGWKSALSKTEQAETSDLCLCANTPLPYPKAGLKNSDDEVDEEEEEEEEEVQGEEDWIQKSSLPEPIEKATDAPEPVDKAADAPELPPSSWYQF